MSPREPQVPPSSEEIHLPGPSILPLLMAIGLTLSLIGVTISLVITALGLAISIPVGIRWFRSTREELDELPE